MRDAKHSGGTKKTPAKVPFDIEVAIPRLRQATAPYPKAALFELAAEGYGSLFEVLIACIISIRTYDETTLPVARNLFARARTPAQMARLSVEEIDALIHQSTFHEAKAPQIHAIAQKAVAEHGGELPCDAGALMAFRGRSEEHTSELQSLRHLVCRLLLEK